MPTFNLPIEIPPALYQNIKSLGALSVQVGYHFDRALAESAPDKPTYPWQTIAIITWDSQTQQLVAKPPEQLVRLAEPKE